MCTHRWGGFDYPELHIQEAIKITKDFYARAGERPSTISMMKPILFAHINSMLLEAEPWFTVVSKIDSDIQLKFFLHLLYFKSLYFLLNRCMHDIPNPEVRSYPNELKHTAMVMPTKENLIALHSLFGIYQQKFSKIIESQPESSYFKKWHRDAEVLEEVSIKSYSVLRPF